MSRPASDRAEPVLRSLPAAFVFARQDGAVFDVTDRVTALTGWTASALVGRPLFDLFSPALQEHLRDVVEHWVAAGASPIEGRLLRLEMITASGASIVVGVQFDRNGEGFAVTLVDMRASGEELRSALLDAVSEPAVTPDGLVAAAAQVGTAFDWDLVTVWSVDDAGTTLRSVATWERDPDPARHYRSATSRQPFLRGEGLPGAAWEKAEVIVVDDVGVDPRFGSGYGTNRRPQTGALIPARVGRRIVGVVELLTYAQVAPNLWLASEADSISASLGQLIERFGARTQTESIEGRLALALEAGELGVWTLDVRSGLAGWSLRMAELHAVDATEGGASSVFGALHPDDSPLVGEVLQRARSADEPQTVEYRVRDRDRGTTWISTRVTRVQSNGGALTLSAVSSDVTEAKRAELSRQRRRAAVEGLQWVSQAIIAGRQLTDTAIAVANAATGVLGADRGVVLYDQPDDVGSAMAWAVSGLSGDEPVPEPPGSVDLASLGEVVGVGVEVIPDLRNAPVTMDLVRALELPFDADELRSALLLPVSGEHGRPLGLMAFVHHEPGYFNDQDARLAASIASITGVAIENARRHEEQRLAAVLFQRQLLPDTDIEVPGVDLCIRYHPGRDGLDVGGDWYDFIQLDEHRIGLAVGDVCGHGLAAASHMGQFRYSFRALIQASATPEDALRVVNQMALRELHTTATVAYVELDTRTGSCAAWCCGHLPPVIASVDGTEVRFVEAAAARGPMLGFLPELAVSPVRTTLAPGELLLLYTDGLVERRNEGIDDGLDRLVASFAGRSPVLEDLCEELYSLLAVAGPDADDTVLVAARRR